MLSGDTGAVLRACPAAAAGPEGCRSTKDSADVHATRYAGADRYATAVCASYWTFDDHGDTTSTDRAGAVVLAAGDAFPDALAGGPLAAHLEGPLLISRTRLRPEVKAEIQRVLAPGGTVYLLGGTAALSDAVAAEVQAAGHTPKRLAGRDRYTTAIRIAEELPPTANLSFTTGTDFPDALAGGPVLARHFAPLLLTRPTTLSANARGFLVDTAGAVSEAQGKPTPAKLIVLGGTRAVSAPVMEEAITAYTP